jgi:hypothetical protein
MNLNPAHGKGGDNLPVRTTFKQTNSKRQATKNLYAGNHANEDFMQMLGHLLAVRSNVVTCNVVKR